MRKFLLKLQDSLSVLRVILDTATSMFIGFFPKKNGVPSMTNSWKWIINACCTFRLILYCLVYTAGVTFVCVTFQWTRGTKGLKSSNMNDAKKFVCTLSMKK